jgi:hypothetical protein
MDEKSLSYVKEPGPASRPADSPYPPRAQRHARAQGGKGLRNEADALAELI